MTIINTSPDRIIQLGYEGEDRVTVLRFRYGADWLENGEGIFHIRVRRHGEHTAYNAQLVTDDRENTTLLMTVTNVELSVKGSGEMQVVYSGADFVKKSPIYSYNVSRAVDEAVDPPAQDVYTQIIESLSDLQTDVRKIESDAADLSELTMAKIGDLTELTTEAKSSLVSAINEVNSKSVDDVLSATSTNPVQNKVITEHIDSLNSTIDGLDSDIQGLQTTIQGKADTQTVTALSDTVSGLQTAMQGKADTATVTALSGTVSSLSDTTQQYMEYTNSAITDLQDNKASKSYVDGELATKANVQTVTALSGTVTDLQTSKADKTYVDVQLDGKASTQTVSDLVDDVYDIYPTDTASGVIANFPDGANSVPVKSLTVAIEPVQDLHGYDSPWPAGGGKNKIPYPYYTADGTVSGVAFSTASDGKITATGTTDAGLNYFLARDMILNAGTYTVSVSGTHTALTLIARDPVNNVILGDVTPAETSAIFTISETTSVRLYFNTSIVGASVNISAYVQLESGNQLTAWSPYSNICPISGWTGCEVVQTGINLFDKTAVETSKYLDIVTGLPVSASAVYCVSDYILVKKGITVFISATSTARRWYYNIKKEPVTYLNNPNNQVFTPPDDGYIRVSIKTDVVSIDTFQIRFGSTATAYEPYQGDIYNITFPTEAGTVYGGSLDVTNGTLTVDRAMVMLDGSNDETWQYYSISQGNLFRNVNNDSPTINASNVEYFLCSEYKPVARDRTNGTLSASTAGYLDFVNNEFNDLSAWKAAINNRPIYVVYPIATPITYQLTPQEVSTLLGQNNIWADAGDTTVEYRANTSAYIAKKIAEAISALS